MASLYDGITYFKKTRLNNENDLTGTDDSNWMVNTFMVKNTSLDNPDDVNRYWSIVNDKFTDTSLGGNIAINTHPQYTRYADIRIKGRVENRTTVKVDDLSGDMGMGRFYGETMDDNAVDVYMTFGVPSFNNLFRYLLTSVDYKKAAIVNTGRSPLFYNIGQTVAGVAMVVAFPVIVPLLWVAKTAYKFLIAPGKVTYYYLKPTMPTYWSTVNSIVNLMSTELGILAPIFTNDGADADKVGTPVKFDKEDLNFLKSYAPDLITKNNYIDVPAVILRAQKARNLQFLDEMAAYENGKITETDFTGLLKKDGADMHRVPEAGLTAKLNKMMMTASSVYGKEDDEENEDIAAEVQSFDTESGFTANDDGTMNLGVRKEDEKSYLDSVKEYFDAETRDGARFLVFRVEDPGSVSETFSNSVSDIGLESGMKAVTNKSRAFKFNLSGGNLIPLVDDAAKAVTDVVSGGLDMVTMGLSNVVTYLLGDANLEMVQRWEESAASLPQITFKTKLIAPYNNPISQLKSMYIPVASLLAATLPRSTGLNSHASPFLASMFVRGYQNIDLGMITSLTISRGTSNLGFSKQRRPLAIDVSFTVTDFSKIISVPTSNSILDPASVIYNDSAPLNKYIAAMCGRDLYTSLHMGSVAKLKISRALGEVDHILSPAYWGMKTGDTFGSVLSGLTVGKGLDYSSRF